MCRRSAATAPGAHCRANQNRAGSRGNNSAAHGSPGANPRANARTNRNHAPDPDTRRRANGSAHTYRDAGAHGYDCAYGNPKSNHSGHA